MLIPKKLTHYFSSLWSVPLLVACLIQLFTVILYSMNLTNPKYSYIGDEYAFYLSAQAIAQGHLSPPAFSLDGVYGEFPVLGSYYQATVMKILGISIFSWKLSSLFIIFPLGIMMFLILKKLFNGKIALVGLIAFNSSFYLYNFFQIGYLNNLSLLFLTLIVLIITYSFNEETPIKPANLIALGIVTGLSWYFYIGKLFIFIVSFFLILKHKYIKDSSYIIFFLSSFLLIIYGLAITPLNSNLFGINKTIFAAHSFRVVDLIKNLLYPLFLPLYTLAPSHYLPTNAYMDRLTGIFAFLGQFILVFTVAGERKKTLFIHILALFILTVIFIGSTSPYPTPATTRGIHYMPFYIIFFCYLLQFIISRFKDLKNINFVLIGISGLIILLNLYYILKPLKQNAMQDILRYMQSMQNENILFVDNCNINFYDLKTLSEGYQLTNSVTIKKSNYSCYRYSYIFSCAKITCNYSQSKSFDLGIKSYKIESKTN